MDWTRKVNPVRLKNAVETPPAPGKNRWWTGKMNCKTMKQTENNQNHKKESTPVVGIKPYGKSQLNPKNSPSPTLHKPPVRISVRPSKLT